MFQTTRAPARDGSCLFWRHLGGGLCPAIDEKPHYVTLGWSQPPVARLTPDAIPEIHKAPFRGRGGFRPLRRPAQSLVGVLMAVHEISNCVVQRLFRRARELAVVGDGEERCRAFRMAMCGKRTEPGFRHEIEQGRRSHKMASREHLAVVQDSEVLLP